MPLEIQIFLIIKAISAIASLFLSFAFWDRRKVYGATYFSLIGIANLIWTLGNMVEILADHLPTKILGLTIAYFGVPFISFLWAAGTFSFITRGKEPTKKSFFMLAIIPIITTLLMITNQYHGLLFNYLGKYKSGEFFLISYDPGPWYYVNVIYSYITIIVTIIYLVVLKNKLEKYYRKQIWLLIFSAVPPWIFSFVHVVGLRSFMPIDYSSSAFVITAMLLGWAVYKYGLFDIIPAARDRVIDAMEDCILVLDKMDRIIDLNPAATRLFGAKEIIGQNLRDAFPKIRALKRLTGESQLVQNEIKIDDKIFEVVSSAVTDKKGNDIGSVYTFRDITKRKNSEDALRIREYELSDLNRTKDKFFSIISHDLKNPFQSILGYTQMMREEYDSISDQEKKEILDSLVGVSKKTQQLLENLLNWAKVQSGKIKVYNEEIFLNEIAVQVFETVSVQAHFKKIKLTSKIPSNVILFTDFDMISVIIRNLVTNALKFTHASGQVEVGAIPYSKYVEIYVKDNGIGMSEEQVYSLFNFKNSTVERGTKGERGTGLGLILCKEFVDKLGGKIWAESKEGKGTKISFTIPL